MEDQVGSPAPFVLSASSTLIGRAPCAYSCASE